MSRGMMTIWIATTMHGMAFVTVIISSPAELTARWKSGEWIWAPIASSVLRDHPADHLAGALISLAAGFTLSLDDLVLASRFPALIDRPCRCRCSRQRAWVSAPDQRLATI